MTMLHAVSPKTEHARTRPTTHNVAVKPCQALKCGHATTYTTTKPAWCEACNPDKHNRQNRRRYNRTYSAQRRVAEQATYEPGVTVPVVVRPGFCIRCGVIRLSRANTRGVCDGCGDE